MTYYYWELIGNLDPIKCLRFGSKDDLGAYNIDLDDIVYLTDDNGGCDQQVYENESIYEMILKFIDMGFVSGSFEF